MNGVNNYSWEDTEVNSWDELTQALNHEPIFPPRDGAGGHKRSDFVFRGMANKNWHLMTSLERLGTPPDLIEKPALRSFGKYAPRGTFAINSEWERLAVAQHNGLPTRCLDWTISPLVAAHFATAEQDYRKEDGVIWCVNITMMRDNFLPPEMHEILHNEKTWLYDVRILENNYLSLDAFDQTDKDYKDILIFFEPPSIDARIHNQYGVLSIMNGPAKSHHEYFYERSAPNLVRRIIIKSDAKQEIRDYLDQNNITERMLFPGLPGLCDWLRRHYSPAEH